LNPVAYQVLFETNRRAAKEVLDSDLTDLMGEGTALDYFAERGDGAATNASVMALA
jgi:hypothetical protein